jgi:hypothetical protein
MQQAEIIHNHENANVATQDKVKPDTEYVRGFNLAAIKLTAIQVNKLAL